MYSFATQSPTNDRFNELRDLFQTNVSNNSTVLRRNTVLSCAIIYAMG